MCPNWFLRNNHWFPTWPFSMCCGCGPTCCVAWYPVLIEPSMSSDPISAWSHAVCSNNNYFLSPQSSSVCLSCGWAELSTTFCIELPHIGQETRLSTPTQWSSFHIKYVCSGLLIGILSPIKRDLPSLIANYWKKFQWVFKLANLFCVWDNCKSLLIW